MKRRAFGLSDSVQSRETFARSPMAVQQGPNACKKSSKGEGKACFLSRESNALLSNHEEGESEGERKGM